MQWGRGCPGHFAPPRSGGGSWGGQEGRGETRAPEKRGGRAPGKMAGPFAACGVCSERGALSPQAGPRGDRKEAAARPRAPLPRLPFPGTGATSPGGSVPWAGMPGHSAGLSASPGRGLNVDPVSDVPGGSLTQASSKTLLRAPFPWELREEEGSGWSQRPCRPRGHLPTCPPSCPSSAPSSHGAPS